MTRPTLPETRAERIALARTTIEQVIEHEDATLTGEHASHAESYPGCWCFTLQAGTFELGCRLNTRIALAMVAAGFGSDTVPAVSYGSPVGNHERTQVGLYYHVPVGAS